MLIQSISHRGLRRLIEDGNSRFLGAELAGRVEKVIVALHQTRDIHHFIETAPAGWRIHRLSAGRGNLWSVSVSGNWRITFEERNNAIHSLNLEDYH